MSDGRYSAIARRHLKVTRTGYPEWDALCPFHGDHTASLRFNVVSGLWKCWACNETGNAESLVRKLGE